MGGENFKDLMGERFQYLKVLERAENLVYKNKKIKVRWLCECDCGKKVIKYSSALKVKDKPVSCGCMTPKPKSKYRLEGLTVGFLTVIEESDLRGVRRGRMWNCLCECGNYILVSSSTLVANEKKSCGCKTKSEVCGTHGMYGTPTHNSWRTMRERCLTPTHKSYEYYKNVTIDPDWIESFDIFYSDMGERPENMTLDRINNELGYCKTNCRWATWSEQQHNKSPNYINKNKGLAGVSKMGNLKFKATIKFEGVAEYLGTFITPEEANKAYNQRGIEIMGEAWIYKGPPPARNVQGEI